MLNESDNIENFSKILIVLIVLIVLKEIITISFTSFTTHFCYFVIAITTHIYLGELDILLTFHYNDIEIISRQCFLEILAVDKEYILMLMKDSTPEQRASTICSNAILQPF